MRCLKDGLPSKVGPPVVFEIVLNGIFGPVGWAGLLAFCDDLNGVTGFTSVGKLLELPSDLELLVSMVQENSGEVKYYEILTFVGFHHSLPRSIHRSMMQQAPASASQGRHRYQVYPRG